MIESGLAKLLATDSRYTAVCPAAPYPVLLPVLDESGLPALTYQVISSQPDATLDGASNVTEYRIQYDAWGKTYTGVKAVQDALRQVLDGYSGLLSDGTVVFDVIRDTASDLYEPDSRLYRVTSDYRVLFSQ